MERGGTPNSVGRWSMVSNIPGPKLAHFWGASFGEFFFFGRDFTLGKVYKQNYEGNLSFEERIFFVPLEQDLYSLLCRLPQPVNPSSCRFCRSMKLAQMGAM